MSCVGPYAKYSSCLYPNGTETLEEAEVLMMALYCERAQLKDGLDILDLGCGMVSKFLSSQLLICSQDGAASRCTLQRYNKLSSRPRSVTDCEPSQRYPRSRIVALSNSATQKAYILSAAATRGLNNIEASCHCRASYFVLKRPMLGYHCGRQHVRLCRESPVSTLRLRRMVSLRFSKLRPYPVNRGT